MRRVLASLKMRAMSPSDIRIGIIGAGGIFRSRHFPGLAKVDDAEVVAVCNRSEESGRKISEEFGLSPDIMIDPHALIARDDIDAVMIGTAGLMALGCNSPRYEEDYAALGTSLRGAATTATPDSVRSASPRRNPAWKSAWTLRQEPSVSPAS